MPIQQKCFLTGLPAQVNDAPGGADAYIVTSPACGRYWVSRTLAASSAIWERYADRLHILAVVARQRSDAGERQTRVALNVVRPAVARYLLEHEGACPNSLQEVVPYMGDKNLPRDAWGRKLRLVCPSVRPGVTFVLMSDGPDGVPGGLDRIEY